MKQIKIGELPKTKAINSLLRFAYRDCMKAGLDIIKALGNDSLKENKHLTEGFLVESNSIPGTSMLYDPCAKLRRHEKEYDETVKELKLEIEERIALVGKKGVTPMLEGLKKELLEINANTLSEEALVNSCQDPPSGISSEQGMIMNMQANYLGHVIFDELLKADDINRSNLKHYANYVNTQYVKLLQIRQDLLLKGDEQRIIADRGNYINERTLAAMFSDKELLIKICDELVKPRKYKGRDVKYLQKVEDGKYKWIGTTVKLAAFGSWLSKNKDRLLIHKEDFDPGKHRGRALCDFFDFKMKPTKKEKDAYQQFQDSRIPYNASDEFIFLNPLI